MRSYIVFLFTIFFLAAPASASDVFIPISRSTLIEPAHPISEVIISDPTIADVHPHGNKAISIIGKSIGITSIRILDKEGKLISSHTVNVGYDLPAIRQALKRFLPNEVIGVEMVNTNVALTGEVRSASEVNTALRIAKEFITRKSTEDNASDSETEQTNAAEIQTGIINLLRVTSGQQVMLKVRVGEISRDSLKRLGVNLSSIAQSGQGIFNFATGGGLGGVLLDAGSEITPGSIVVDNTEDLQGFFAARYAPSNGNLYTAAIEALERDGLFKTLAEPNLVAISGEEAEFLAGGEIPVPVPQSGEDSTITIEFKPFGVGVRFRPFVLSENRIRMDVNPEVSELDFSNAISLEGFQIPALTTRRAKTTVELAPGESFMIAGLIKDDMRSAIEQLPGLKELPILGALFRSTEFERNETELVIAVTPYLVDPMKHSNVRLPTDNFRPPSQMEMTFYGALSSLSGNAYRVSQTPSIEGPIGFMVE